MTNLNKTNYSITRTDSVFSFFNSYFLEEEKKKKKRKARILNLTLEVEFLFEMCNTKKKKKCKGSFVSALFRFILGKLSLANVFAYFMGNILSRKFYWLFSWDSCLFILLVWSIAR